MSWYVILLCLFSSAAAVEFSSGAESCTTKELAPGICVHAKKCKEFKNAQDLQHRRPTICRFDGKDPIICCKKSATGNTPLLQCGIRQTLDYETPSRSKRQTTQTNNDQMAISVHSGQPAVPGEWPWMVALGRPKKQFDRQLYWFCGGTLVGRHHVVTAAHCLSTPQKRAGLITRLGATDLQEVGDLSVQDRRVSRVLLHPQFQLYILHNDIALLTLSHPADLTSTVQPACLPLPGVPDKGRLVQVAGWGLTEYRGTERPSHLQETTLQVSDILQCERNYSGALDFQSKFPGGFKGTKLCAKDWLPDSYRGACRGDSGGPLVLRQDGRYQLLGVVLAGVGCDNNYPGIYTRVSAYVGWIRQAMLN